jgi:hypothetical protein
MAQPSPMGSSTTSVRRILKELSELVAEPSPLFTVNTPEDSNLFEIHFTIRYLLLLTLVISPGFGQTRLQMIILVMLTQ